MNDFGINFKSEEFTRHALVAIKTAILCAGELGHSYIGTEHLLLGISEDTTSCGGGILRKQGVTPEKIRAGIISLEGTSKPTKPGCEAFTPAVKRCLRLSKRSADDISHTVVGTEHLLCALLGQQNSTARTVLSEQNCNISRLYAVCSEAIEAAAGLQDKALPQKPKNLSKYGFDMVQRAAQTGYDPCVGREGELDRLMSILIRRNKNNPCILGEAGVGKTALVEALASKISEQSVPEPLLGKSIYSLNMASLLAGAKYRGDFEERLKMCIDEAINDKSIILFIDELHTLCGAGGAEGAIDAGNILKPMLARGELKIIGATTYDEYMQTVEKDKALSRRFCTLVLNEPTCEQAAKMLMSLKGKYESYHGVTITDSAVNAAVRLTHRYIPDRRLPDKAIDLLDEACSCVKLNNFTNSENIRRSLSDVFSSYLSGEISKEDYFSRLSGYASEDFNRPTVDERAVSSTLALQMKLPDYDLTPKKIDNICERLRQNILNQEQAIATLSASLKRAASGLQRDKKPFTSILFVGQTGVGKTALASLLAKELFGEDSLIRLDMTEFSEAHTVSRIIGAPAGYIGHGNGGELTEKIRRRPRSLLLIDEFEKAHFEVRNLFLQILDTATLTDSLGRLASFEQTLIIFTSNAKPTSSAIGFGDKQSAMSASVFSKELTARFDAVCQFSCISQKSAIAIVQKELNCLADRCMAKGVILTFTDGVAERVVDMSDYKTYGVRQLQHTISREIESPLCDVISDKATKEIICQVQDGRIILTADVIQTA